MLPTIVLLGLAQTVLANPKSLDNSHCEKNWDFGQPRLAMAQGSGDANNVEITDSQIVNTMPGTYNSAYDTLITGSVVAGAGYRFAVKVDNTGTFASITSSEVGFDWSKAGSTLGTNQCGWQANKGENAYKSTISLSPLGKAPLTTGCSTTMSAISTFSNLTLEQCFEECRKEANCVAFQYGTGVTVLEQCQTNSVLYCDTNTNWDYFKMTRVGGNMEYWLAAASGSGQNMYTKNYIMTDRKDFQCIQPPSPPDFGSIEFSDLTNDGSVATFSCDLGYVLSGEATSTCIAETNGAAWPTTPAWPTCESGAASVAPALAILALVALAWA